MRIPKSLYELIEALSKDLNLVQGFGGNVSVKSEGEMVVKASGLRIGDISSPDYFHHVRLSDDTGWVSMPHQVSRPSIETSLHARTASRYTLHLHSAQAVALSANKGHATGWVYNIVPNFLGFAEYKSPGEELADSIFNLIRGEHNFSVILTNHGTLFGSDSVSRLASLVKALESRIEAELLRENNLGGAVGAGLALSKSQAHHILYHCKHNWRISPDHVVFLGLEPPESFIEHLRLGYSEPIDVGSHFGKTHLVEQITEQLEWFFRVALLSPRKKLRTISLGEAQPLIARDDEQFRIRSAE